MPAWAEEIQETEEFGAPDKLVISEIMYDPSGPNSEKTEWFEIYNAGDEAIFLDPDKFGFKEKETASCHKIDREMEILPEEFLIIAENREKFLEDPVYENVPEDMVLDSSFDFSSTQGYLKLSVDRCQKYFIDFSFEGAWGGKDNGKTLEKIDITSHSYSQADWQESCPVGGTPGAESSDREECEEEEDPADTESEYVGRVYMNEIYPSPDTKTGEEEFVEIVSLESELDLSGWSVKDAKLTKPKISEIYQNDNFWVIAGAFSLNSDSKGDTVYLYDDKGHLVESLAYSSGQSRASYAYDGQKWRWTTQKTPGGKNQFDKILTGKIKRSDKAYVGMYVNFSVKTGKEAKKFTWNFGDGKKSYLKEARHKYEKAGTYQASLKITGDGETTVQNFTVKVEKYKAPKIRIIRLSPNPKGSDAGEWIMIENKSKKKVDLLNWAVATGWENLYSHPIRKKFELKPGQAKKLTKADCAFTLNNTKTKIELRDPSGKTVQKIKYDRQSNKIEEDETYFELSGQGWQWDASQVVPRKKVAKTKQKTSSLIPAVSDTSVLLDDYGSFTGRFTPDPEWAKKQEYQILLANANIPYNVHLIAPVHGSVLGANTEQIIEPEKPWAVKILRSLIFEINIGLNWILNNLL